MDFAYDDDPLIGSLRDFMDSHIYPAESAVEPPMAALKDAARERGLWNLFLELPTLRYAPLAEISGRSPFLAPEATNCNAPDSGNMEVLARFGTHAQRERWLAPLLDGTIRSAFCMTEPGVASSDATTIATSITRHGGEYVVDGHKWFASGALHPRCEVLLVLGRTDPDAPKHRQHSLILVPADAPGVQMHRGMTVFGYSDTDHGGHAEITFSQVRVPVANLVGESGSGFAIGQARLGPGRVHHCMRLIGMAERALALMCERASSRIAFGKLLAAQGVVGDWIAEARVRIEQARLLVLKTAWLIDTVGNKAARTEIQAIKVVTPAMTEWVLDKAIQVHGGAGVSQDTPLARFWAQARALRIADGPDEVHRQSIARNELKTATAAPGVARSPARHLPA